MRRSSQDVGADNAAKLLSWVDSTPLGTVPRNQFGTTSRAQVCRLLSIPPSTIGTNEAILKIFEKLDKRLSQTSVEPRKDVREALQEGESVVISKLLTEIEELRAELARFQHLSDSGQWVPK